MAESAISSFLAEAEIENLADYNKIRHQRIRKAGGEMTHYNESNLTRKLDNKSVAESIKIQDDFDEEDMLYQFSCDVNNPETVYNEMPLNAFGNLQISLFWEEKIILIIKFLQMYGFLLHVFYEYYPYKYQNELGPFLFLLSADFGLVGTGPQGWYTQV